ncbi:MAG: 50S ribosomal protein L15 [Candidatus Micrarchaeota archaeon]|nr:50S ribosomal protein L15 [Candidatus Micrarchaeota archaeon]
MARLKKRNRKFLGSRSHGKGNAKNRRGKGNKGGWGRAGMHKHRYSYITAYEPDFFGVHGFVPPKKQKPKCINLWQIDRYAALGKLQKKDGKDYFEFSGKVLGTGSINHPVIIKALSFSRGAEEKIRAAGGRAEKLSSSEKGLNTMEKN